MTDHVRWDTYKTKRAAANRRREALARLTKVLLATQAVTLVGLGISLWAVYGPPTEDELRRTLFYMNGRQSAMVMGLDKVDAGYKTCTEALAELLRQVPGRPKWATPKTDADRDAFLLGCKEELLTKYDKES